MVVKLDDIQDLANRIAQQFHPERIILFGSYAYGKPSPDSDVDLLVVLPFEGKTWRMASEIRRRVRPQFPMDLLVRTPGQMRDRLQKGDCYFKEISNKGRVLYEA